ncbi:MAG TPA: hypothetical protein VIB62_08085 [Actinomycetota bacterium]|jgi:hypothetical protein
MPTEIFDPLRILASLEAHGVRYVLIGGLAAVAHGSPAETDDVDICLAGDDGNLRRMGLALADLGGRDNPATSTGTKVSFETAAGRLDCFELLPTMAGYPELSEDAVLIDIGHGIRVHIASIVDLTEMTRSAGDLTRAAHLAALAQSADVVELGPARERRRWRELIPTPRDRGERKERKRPERVVDLSTDPEPEPTTWTEKVLRRLENVDAFLTDLNDHGLPRRRDRKA